MIISPRSSHSLGIFVVWNDVVIVRELFVADRADARLLSNLAIQQLAHLAG